MAKTVIRDLRLRKKISLIGIRIWIGWNNGFQLRNFSERVDLTDLIRLKTADIASLGVIFVIGNALNVEKIIHMAMVINALKIYSCHSIGKTKV